MFIGLKMSTNENKDFSDYDAISLTDSLDGNSKSKHRKLKKIFTYKSKKIDRKKEVIKVDEQFHFGSSQDSDWSVNTYNHEVEKSVTTTQVLKLGDSNHSDHSIKGYESKTDSYKKNMEKKEETHKLFVQLLKGENLAARDSNGLSDPYVKFKIGHRTIYRSKCCKMTLNPIWNENFEVPVSLDSTLLVRVFDKDRGLRDDFMGSTSIELSQLEESHQEMRIKLEEYNSDEDLGFIHLAIHIQPLNNNNLKISNNKMPIQEVDSVRTSDSAKRKETATLIKRGSTRHHRTATATIQLVSGSDLPARDANGLSDPYVKLTLGKTKKKSKVCYKTLCPIWKEEFTFDVASQETSILEISVWDKDSYRKDDFIGRCTLDLWSLGREETHSLSLDLTDTSGSILILATVLEFDPRQQQRNLTHYDLVSLTKQYAYKQTFKDLKDIGFAEIEIISATNLKSADINGKSDPFCVVQLCNARVQTHTCYKTLDPIWNRVFTFPIHDIHDVFEISIYDEDTEDKEFLGRCSIPILSVCNGVERSYVMKDRKLRERAKGSLNVKINYIFNPARAAIRTFTPREEKHMQEVMKFRKNLLTRNFHRVWSIVQSIIFTIEFVNSCFTWTHPRRSLIAFVSFLLIVWNFELYMLPIMLLMIFLKNYVEIFVQKTRSSSSISNEDHNRFSSADDDDDEDESSNQKLSILGRLNAIQDILTKVQNILDVIASFGERVYNTFTWGFPFLSWLAVLVLSLACLVLYFVPLRAIVLLWGVNKFTKRLRKPNYVPNNELMDFMSRVPSNIQLREYQELPNNLHSRQSKKKK